MLNTITLAALLGFSLAQQGTIRANPQTRMMEDQHGRSVIFHGVNVVYKVHPYIPQQDVFDGQLSLTDKDIDDLVRWGFNFVRLGVMWEAVERAPGVYNDTYLDEVEKLINKMGEKGLYTLVDAHQDVFARHICGEGVPDFYAADDVLEHTCTGGYIPFFADIVGLCKSIKDYGFRFDKNGDPVIEDCQKNNFAMYYPTAESISGFERLYDNIDGFQDKFIAYWAKVALRFANNPFVVGYDPLNEPFPSNFLKDPYLVLEPGNFDRTKLQPLYKRAFEAYQSAGDASKIMFFEPAEFPDEIGILGGLVFHLGFTEPPGGAENTNLHVLNDHTYCCQLSADMCSTGEPPLDKA
jgi:endoglycosylceramidase